MDRESVRVYDINRENGVPEENEAEADSHSDQVRSIVVVGHLRQKSRRRHLCRDLISKGRLHFGHMHRDYFHLYTDRRTPAPCCNCLPKQKNIDASYVGTREFLSRLK